ncbi:hypothetical protein AAMO2058_001726000 [Amorphochlora amoebiformis]
MKKIKPLQDLIFAAGRGELDKVKEALEDGADVNGLNATGWSALTRATYNNHKFIVRFLVEDAKGDLHVAAPGGKNLTALQLAAKNGRESIVQYLIESAGDKPGIRSERGESLLHLCSGFAGYGKLEVFEYLVENTTLDVDAEDNDGITPLMKAASCGNVDLVRYLIKAKADVNARAHHTGDTALILCVKCHAFDMAEYLAIQTNCDILVKGTNGSAIELAVMYGGKKLAETLRQCLRWRCLDRDISVLKMLFPCIIRASASLQSTESRKAEKKRSIRERALGWSAKEKY